MNYSTFPARRPRLSRPEATGLRHLALAVDDLDVALAHVRARGVSHEEIRVDELTGCRFAFFEDPDALPIELVEVPPRFAIEP